MIDKLEKKLGRFAIKNLIYYILGGYVVGYILMLTDSRLGLYQYITLSPDKVMQGQVWRLFSWVLTPPQGLSFWVIFMFLFFFFIGRSLEQYLGSFRYNLYMFSGWFFMTLGAMAIYWVTSALYKSGVNIFPVSISTSTYYLNMASFLAFAAIFPDVKVYLLGIIPIKMKWLAIVDLALLGLEVLEGLLYLVLGLFPYIYNTASQLINEMYQGTLPYAFETRPELIYEGIISVFSILISLLNFLLFWLTNKKLKGQRRTAEDIRRAKEYKKNVEEGQKKAGYNAGTIVHRCHVCGRTSTDHPELSFRYCSKCNGNYEYCEEHLFTHEHIG